MTKLKCISAHSPKRNQDSVSNILTKERMVAFYYLKFNTDKEMQKPGRKYSDTASVSQKVRQSPETELDLLFGFPIWVCLGFLIYLVWV